MKHQIICTYCENDFYTGEKGFGVSSASRGFPAKYKEELLKRGRYTPPKIPADTVLTPELCELMPESFSYFKIGKKYALGRVKLTGRVDDGYNSLAHFITVDKEEGGRWIEYASSPDFIYSTEDVSTGYCSDTKLRRGEAVNVNKVMNFLSFPGRAKIFEKMIKAALVCQRNGGKLVISDKYENILMWIGAVMYALPKKVSEALTFCSYTHDPENCTEDICGVFAKGTAYSPEKIKFPNVLFDMYEDIWPKDEQTDAYCSFIAASMSHDYRAVTRFNEFTEQYFDFKVPTYDITVAYGIYSVLNSGVESVSADDLKVCTVLLEHSIPALTVAVSEKLIAQSDILGQSEPVFMYRGLEAMCMAYPHASLAHKAAIREAVAKCVFMLMIGEHSDEQSFEAFYSKLDEMTDKSGFSMTDELMSTENRRKLTAILTYKPAKWKTAFAVKLLSDYIVKNDVPASSLTPDSPLGAFIADIVNSGEKAGIQLDNAISVISPLAPYCLTFCNAYARAFDALVSLEGGEDNSEQLRDRFAKLAASAQLENRDTLFGFFLENEDYKTLYACYSAMMSVCDGKTASALYTGHYESCFAVNADYSAEYLIRASEDYYAAAVKCGDDAKRACTREIFDVISAKKVVIPSSQACIDDICSRIELSPPSDSERELIKRMNEYVLRVRDVVPTGRLLTLVFALECEKIDNRKDYGNTKEALTQLTVKEKINLTRCEEDEWEDLFKWILPIFTELLLSAEEIEFIYDRFILNTEQSGEFFEEFTKEFIKHGKDESDYSELCRFLKFVYKCGSESDKEAVASQIRKLNSKRIEILTLNAETVYQDSPGSQDAFAELMSMPVKKGGFFSSLFKKK